MKLNCSRTKFSPIYVYAILLGSLATHCFGETGNSTIRVLSYNIHHGAGTDGKLDLQRIARVIGSANPDIVALQEVDQRVTRSGTIDQPAELAKLTGMQVLFAGNIALQGGLYGNAVLTRFAVNEQEHILLPNHDKGEQRGLIRAKLELGELGHLAAKINFTATHFDHRSNETERIASAHKINKIAAGAPDSLSLLAGDINDVRGSETLKVLQSHWKIAGPTLATIPSAKPTRQIDFIFFRPEDRWTVTKTQVLGEAVASDHRAILSVLKFSGQVVEHQEVKSPSIERSRPDRKSLLLAPTPDGQQRVARNVQQWQPRKKAILAAMQSVMGQLPEAPPNSIPEIELIEEIDCGEYVRRKILYQSQPGNKTPAYLCIPKQALRPNAKPLPAVLCLHPTDNTVGNGVVVGLGGKPNRQYASELSVRGYVTLAPAYPLLADYQPNLKDLGWESGTLLAVWDNMRAIDLLGSLPFVDSRAIGAIGHSLGGHNAIYTAAFDERIVAIVSSCGFDSYQDYYGGDPRNWIAGKGWTQLRYMPKLSDYAGRLNEIPFDFDQILGTLAPRPVMVVSPLHDSNFQADSVDWVTQNAAAVYELHGQAKHLTVLHPDCKHDFPEPMRMRAYQMFDEFLKSQ